MYLPPRESACSIEIAARSTCTCSRCGPASSCACPNSGAMSAVYGRTCPSAGFASGPIHRWIFVMVLRRICAELSRKNEPSIDERVRSDMVCPSPRLPGRERFSAYEIIGGYVPADFPSRLWRKYVIALLLILCLRGSSRDGPTPRRVLPALRSVTCSSAFSAFPQRDRAALFVPPLWSVLPAADSPMGHAQSGSTFQNPPKRPLGFVVQRGSQHRVAPCRTPSSFRIRSCNGTCLRPRPSMSQGFCRGPRRRFPVDGRPFGEPACVGAKELELHAPWIARQFSTISLLYGGSAAYNGYRVNETSSLFAREPRLFVSGCAAKTKVFACNVFVRGRWAGNRSRRDLAAFTSERTWRLSLAYSGSPSNGTASLRADAASRNDCTRSTQSR